MAGINVTLVVARVWNTKITRGDNTREYVQISHGKPSPVCPTYNLSVPEIFLALVPGSDTSSRGWGAGAGALDINTCRSAGYPNPMLYPTPQGPPRRIGGPGHVGKFGLSGRWSCIT